MLVASQPRLIYCFCGNSVRYIQAGVEDDTERHRFGPGPHGTKHMATPSSSCSKKQAGASDGRARYPAETRDAPRPQAFTQLFEPKRVCAVGLPPARPTVGQRCRE
eukprot:gene12191-biopygen18460